MRDHGGNLDWAIRTHGGDPQDWIDLSTGINPVAYPVPPLPDRAWTALPTRSDMAGLQDAAAARYRAFGAVVPLAGAQAAIQLVPRLAAPGRARVLIPTYNEHAAALKEAGWQVETVSGLDDLSGADLAVVVTPNNPDGQVHAPGRLRALAATVGLLVIDESFGDATPELCCAPSLGAMDNVVVLRSFGKFYGLAGIRLGFALTCDRLAERLRGMAGPWPVSGAAIHVAMAALRDGPWIEATTARLRQDSERLDRAAEAAGLRLVGGTTLFRTYSCAHAESVQKLFCNHRIWSRVFPYSNNWLRLGLPAPGQWNRIEEALEDLSARGL